MRYAWLAGMLLMLTGCGTFSTGSSVTLTEKDANRTITAGTGDVITLQLASNPTTGYQWQVSTGPAESAPAVEVVKEDFIAPANKELCGAPGQEVFRLKAVHPGSATVTARYYRLWEEFNPAADTEIRYTIEVK